MVGDETLESPPELKRDERVGRKFTSSGQGLDQRSISQNPGGRGKLRNHFGMLRGTRNFNQSRAEGGLLISSDSNSPPLQVRAGGPQGSEQDFFHFGGIGFWQECSLENPEGLKSLLLRPIVIGIVVFHDPAQLMEGRLCTARPQESARVASRPLVFLEELIYQLSGG